MGDRASSRRGLLVVAVLLLLVLAVLDLLGSDSLLRAAWDAMAGGEPATPAERMLERLR